MEVAGSLPILLQWFYQGTQVLLQATNKVLRLRNVTLAMGGSYSVEASNVAGVIRSPAVNLTVLALPSVVRAPQSITVIQGGSATFEVTASGGEPLDYQWFGPDGTALPGATQRVLVLNNVTASEGGEYTVRVRNEVGELLSDVAKLFVIVPPAILTSLSNQFAARGGGNGSPISGVRFTRIRLSPRLPRPTGPSRA